MASGQFGRYLSIGTERRAGGGGSQPAGPRATDDQEPQDIIRWALTAFAPGRVALCTSFQIDGMAILDMAWRIDPDVRIFTVDTGKMPAETHALIEQVRRRYTRDIEIYRPDDADVAALVEPYGEDLFRQSVPLRLQCCEVRKVRPLARVLCDLDAWITGLRRDQSATRSNIRKIELDHSHGGIVKVNPLADWTEAQVWDYVRANDVPYHPLYDQGYRSIGCAPCTRPVPPGADGRAGRWWWEGAGTPKECGMHCAVGTGVTARVPVLA
jgi:phosphoadenosine phosphosulfate reductase